MESGRAGVSQSQIGRETGISQSVVGRLLRANGIVPARNHASGAVHGSWKGGRWLSGGYVRVHVASDHPMESMRDASGYVLEHRLVLAEQIGRPLSPTETVHHINGNRTDNRAENLQLRQGKHGKHQQWICGDCGSHNIVSAPLPDTAD